MRGYLYILECNDGTYYTGSTKNLEKRLQEHANSLGANYTKKKLPVKLVYFEEYSRIDEAFYREKQIQRWSHAKKKALIENRKRELPLLAKRTFRKGHLDKPLRSNSMTNKRLGLSNVYKNSNEILCQDRQPPGVRLCLPDPSKAVTVKEAAEDSEKHLQDESFAAKNKQC